MELVRGGDEADLASFRMLTFHSVTDEMTPNAPRATTPIIAQPGTK
jgi:hypothetical protein